MLRPKNARPRRVLIFNHSYPVQFIDVANQYARQFTRVGDEVTVVYLTGKADEGARQKTLAKEVIFLDCPPRVTRGLKLAAIQKMLRLQAQKAFDVVICHRYKPAYIMLWVALFYRIPNFIMVMHELGTLRSWARKLLLACLAPKNLILAGVSNAVRDDLRRSVWRLPPGRVLTLYNMIDVELTEPRFFSAAEAREKLGLGTQDFVFGTVGRLAKNKDQKTLVRAFAQIHEACPTAKLIILGDGQLENELKQEVASLHLTSKVLFTGFVPEGFRYMKAFDVYVSSSIQEAFGRVLLEAMLAQVPTIATRVNGMPEVLGNTGVLVSPADPNSLANEMLRAYRLSSEKRLQWSSQGYQRVTQEFSMPRFSEILGFVE